MEQQNDPVLRPDHYTAGGIETIDFIRAKLTPEMYEGYMLGNVLKYLTQYQFKNGLQDLRKAERYLGWLIGLVQLIEERGERT